jgi:GT2 family glycosyltransferase
VSSDPAPDVSVVIVTWNSLGVTSDCLRSLREHIRGVSYEVLLIDNGTTKDDTPAAIPARFPWVRFIANPDNRGFTKANNQGIREARGRYVLLLNSDTVQTEDAVTKAVAYADAHPEVGVLGITHRNNDAERSFQPSFHPFPRPWSEALSLFRGSSPSSPPEVKEQDADWVCGSFFLIRRATLERVGLLDERYFAYNEDIDWCLQAKRAGWKVRFWPGAEMIHLGSVAAPHLRDKTGLMYRSQLIYLRKNHGPVVAAAYYAAMGLRLGLAVAKQGAFWLAGRARWADVRARRVRLVNFLLLRPRGG